MLSLMVSCEGLNIDEGEVDAGNLGRNLHAIQDVSKKSADPLI